MGFINLTGVDRSNPEPGFKREVRFNQGPAGGVSLSRSAVILCNKLASVGDTSVDGLGDALNTPIPIYGGEEEVIARAGYHSEAYLLYKLFCSVNKDTLVHLCIVPLGSGAGTFDCTIAVVSPATAATQTCVLRVYIHGDVVEVPVAVGDSPATVATAAIAAINAKLEWNVVASSGGSGVITITSSMAGTRHDWALTKARFSFSKSCGLSATKGSVTAGSTDDDQTTAVANLANYSNYYHVNPKIRTTAVSATDNGIGEHLAVIADMWSAPVGKSAVLIAGSTGTPSQSTTVGVSMNSEKAFLVCAENNDWSPAQLATHFASILAQAELSDRAPNLAGYGLNSGDKMLVPPPFLPGDRPTTAEIKTLLNNGCTPIKFSGNGKSYLPWYVTTRSLTNSVNDYRSRPGQTPSVDADFAESAELAILLTKQPKVAADPVGNEKPLPGFSYPRDRNALIRKVVDDKCDAGLLDPSQRQAMKDSVISELNQSGINTQVEIACVKHDLYQNLLILDVSPAV